MFQCLSSQETTTAKYFKVGRLLQGIVTKVLKGLKDQKGNRGRKGGEEGGLDPWLVISPGSLEEEDVDAKPFWRMHTHRQYRTPTKIINGNKQDMKIKRHNNQ